MQRRETDCDGFSTSGGELPLSSFALSELLEAVVERGCRLRFQVRGYSMFPFIRDGDVVTVGPWRPSRFSHGQVLAFRNPSSEDLCVHRVVARKGDSLLLRGDAADQADGLVPSDGVLGRVTSVERDGCKLALGLGSERFLIALLSRTGIMSALRRALGAVRGCAAARAQE